MAKTKARPRKMKTKTAPPPRQESLRIRMTSEFKAWLEDVAARERLTVASVIERYVVAEAKRNGHPKPPGR